MRTAITAIALAGLTTVAQAHFGAGTVTLTSSALTVNVGDAFTIGVILTDDIGGESIFSFDLEVSSAGSMGLSMITDPVPDPSVFGFAGVATLTGATALGGSPDILGPDLDDSLDDVRVFTFQVTATSAGTRTFTASDGPGPNSAMQWGKPGIVLLPVDYDEVIFKGVTVTAVPAPPSLLPLALAIPLASRRRR